MTVPSFIFYDNLLRKMRVDFKSMEEEMDQLAGITLRIPIKLRRLAREVWIYTILKS